MSPNDAPVMAVHSSGHGPDVVLFHGGMGCWQHWVRNIEALAAHFTVHALDHPAYGASADVPRDTTGPEYLDLVYGALLELFPDDTPLRFAGFSFGGAIATHLARRLGKRVTHLCLISPGGFLPRRNYADRPTRSYKSAGDDAALFRDICRHNLLVNMLSTPEAISEDTLDIQEYCVRRTRFNSRKVSAGGTLLGDLVQLSCRLRLLWGERDDSVFRPAEPLIAQIREAVGQLDLHRIPQAGHWSAYENAAVVNQLLIEFFTMQSIEDGAGHCS
jgi:pimeloyl-ACP methyl ester carboxylesterase